ncbi:unnamed protein product [Prunus armeniaca]|uniref:Uncharacterized protein n=1 Tax=Prunus armeniaca TaxID=36596 RepID=A0A6J5WW52_PRUAR|nr:unnamed protein product [Prunus armeniaca]
MEVGEGMYLRGMRKPYEYLPTGRKSYLDEQDIVTFLDPPKGLILWTRLLTIPLHIFERRHRLLRLLEPRLISRAWEIAGTRYEDPNLAKRSASKLLSNEDGAISLNIIIAEQMEGMCNWMFCKFQAIFLGRTGRFMDDLCMFPCS